MMHHDRSGQDARRADGPEASPIGDHDKPHALWRDIAVRTRSPGTWWVGTSPEQTHHGEGSENRMRRFISAPKRPSPRLSLYSPPSSDFYSTKFEASARVLDEGWARVYREKRYSNHVDQANERLGDQCIF